MWIIISTASFTATNQLIRTKKKHSLILAIGKTDSLDLYLIRSQNSMYLWSCMQVMIKQTVTSVTVRKPPVTCCRDHAKKISYLALISDHTFFKVVHLLRCHFDWLFADRCKRHSMITLICFLYFQFFIFLFFYNNLKNYVRAFIIEYSDSFSLSCRIRHCT